MCGRGASIYDRASVARFLEVSEVEAEELPLSWNVAPTRDVYVVGATRTGTRKLRALRWGLIPHWVKSPKDGRGLINARAETLSARPAFRDLVRSRRALVPFSGFYEWGRPADGAKMAKQPYYFASADGSPLAIAALWDIWRDAEGRPLRTVALITTAANATMAPIHDRMPVILPRSAWEEWLSPRPSRAEQIQPLLAPAPDDLLVRWPVSSAVNSTRNDSPELIEPVEGPLP